MQHLGHPVTNNRQNPLVEETIKDFTCKVNGFSSYFDKVNCDVSAPRACDTSDSICFIISALDTSVTISNVATVDLA